jgi:DNA-binding NarL/FixJ family response regulator
MFSSLIQTSIDLDVIFLDINMPFKDGITCLKEIRSMQNYNSIKVVIYSTSNSVKDIDNCYSMGANFYLTKPTCYSSGLKQLKDLFQNDYFINNIKPPREEFVIDSSKREINNANTKFQTPFLT